MINPLKLKEYCLKRDVYNFSKDILGIKLHAGQAKWVNDSWKLINILKPANQWGKTLVESILHIFHAVTKIMLLGRIADEEVWGKITYETANIGKTYEIAKGVFETVQAMVNSNLLLPTGKTNESLLEGWAIREVKEVSNRPPEIHWWNNSVTLFRSYDDFGAAFKRKKLAFVSADECGDIPELKLFLNGTLLPRIAYYKGPIHLVGTSQPSGIEYEELAQTAMEESPKKDSPYYFQSGNMYENPFLDPDFVKTIEEVADPELRKQIIHGYYVDYKEKFFNMAEVMQIFGTDMDWDQETGFSEPIDPRGYYICSLDISASRDDTVFLALRYGERWTATDGTVIELPYKIVFYKSFRGDTMPLSLQYELVKNWYMAIKNIAKNTRFTYDSFSLGGKNVGQQLLSLHGYPFPPENAGYTTVKGEALGILKEVVSRNRKFRTGTNIDENHNWGMIRASPKLSDLRKQLEGYRLKDDDIKQDAVMALMQATYFIEKRKPRFGKVRVVDFNIYRTMIGRYN